MFRVPLQPLLDGHSGTPTGVTDEGKRGQLVEGEVPPGERVALRGDGNDLVDGNRLIDESLGVEGRPEKPEVNLAGAQQVNGLPGCLLWNSTDTDGSSARKRSVALETFPKYESAPIRTRCVVRSTRARSRVR